MLISGTEIERKFHLRRFPSELTPASEQVIAQGYLATWPTSVRLRRCNDEFFLTVKSGQGLTRSETEVSLSPEQYQTLWPLTENRRLEKIRTVFFWQNWKLEVDRYLGRLAPLQVVEVEFPNEAVAQAFVPPDFFGEELTGRPEFLNSSLAEAAHPPVLPKAAPKNTFEAEANLPCESVRQTS